MSRFFTYRQRCNKRYHIKQSCMAYEQKDFAHLYGTEGFSDALLDLHLTLYGGYVKSTNILVEKLELAERGTPEYSEMQRRLGWEWNGMRLHELYFGNLSKNKTVISEELVSVKKITEVYGSREAWEEDFRSCGAMRGIGWVICAYDVQSGRLFNTWINEHDIGHLSGTVPLIVMDVFEHAFITEYGLDRSAYMDAFFSALDWNVVENRFTKRG